MSYNLSILDRLSKRCTSIDKLEIDHTMASIKKALMDLLNTKQRQIKQENSQKEVNQSFITYGIIEISRMESSSKNDLKKLEKSIESAILQHEKRILNPSVKITNAQNSPFTISIKVEGSVEFSPKPIQITFNSQLDLNSNHFSSMEAMYEE